MVNHKIVSLADPENDGDPVSKSYLNTVIQKSPIKLSHKTNQFVYLMQNTLKWPDLTSGGNIFNMTKIADLSPEEGNSHSYNQSNFHQNDEKFTGRL